MDGMSETSAVGLGFVVFILVVWNLTMATLEPIEYGLEYSWFSQTVKDNRGMAFTAGRYILGPASGFIKFPSVVETVQFSTELAPDVQHHPPIKSRTRDGLAVELECSMQWQLMPQNVLKLYETFDNNYPAVFAEVAKTVLMTEATKHSSQSFFQNRTVIAPMIELELRKVFQFKLLSNMPFFQLRNVVLPRQFEDSIRETQMLRQEVLVVEAQRQRLAVEWETELLKAQQHVMVRINQARAKAEQIVLNAGAQGKRELAMAEGQSAVILVKGNATARATLLQRQADAAAVLADYHTKAETVRLRSTASFEAANRSHYLEAESFTHIMTALGHNEQHFLELMHIRALQNVTLSKITVNVGKDVDPLTYMGLASAGSR